MTTSVESTFAASGPPPPPSAHRRYAAAAPLPLPPKRRTAAVTRGRHTRCPRQSPKCLPRANTRHRATTTARLRAGAFRCQAARRTAKRRACTPARRRRAAPRGRRRRTSPPPRRRARRRRSRCTPGDGVREHARAVVASGGGHSTAALADQNDAVGRVRHARQRLASLVLALHRDGSPHHGG